MYYKIWMNMFSSLQISSHNVFIILLNSKGNNFFSLVPSECILNGHTVAIPVKQLMWNIEDTANLLWALTLKRAH